jgi:nuclear cap-binding protein subunit 1
VSLVSGSRGLKLLIWLPSIAHPYHDAAQSVLGLLRGRSKAEDVMSLRIPQELVSRERPRHSKPRQHSTVHRYSVSPPHRLPVLFPLPECRGTLLPLLRNLAAGGISSSGGIPSLEARMDILTASSRFWNETVKWSASCSIS